MFRKRKYMPETYINYNNFDDLYLKIEDIYVQLE